MNARRCGRHHLGDAELAVGVVAEVQDFSTCAQEICAPRAMLSQRI